MSPETPEVAKIVMIESDSLLAVTYSKKFNTLYDDLMALDKVNDGMHSREIYHNNIRDLSEEWVENMLYLDSLGKGSSLSQKEFNKMVSKYDPQLARFILYGNEDIDEVKVWAEAKAEQILKKIAVDPESLIIESVICNGKTNKGWKCSVVYRAKNGFGGYVREHLTLILDYNEYEHIYDCVDAW